jgi:hypothetical protein
MKKHLAGFAAIVDRAIGLHHGHGLAPSHAQVNLIVLGPDDIFTRRERLFCDIEFEWNLDSYAADLRSRSPNAPQETAGRN